ncbi:MAG: hypothetical protein HYX75_23295 [Acidobacteria bacterium]|nr:hypothetical protein [Acidobacteriota bacterium]
MDDLAARRAEIRPFVESARKNTKSGATHRSPFYLRLAAELLREGENPSRLADWNSPAVLMRKFWEIRVKEGDGAHEREVTLRAICRRMVDLRAMRVSLKELSLCAAELSSVDELRSGGILQAPKLRRGTSVGGDEIRFTHHLLHDYAIARSLIPETPGPFYDFALRESVLPIFYRQSFIFALEELWDADPQREEFWECALQLESVTKLYGITRILAPILAARRVESPADLQPLLRSLGPATDSDSPGQQALRHLASGVQDADDNAIRVGAAGWCAFARELAGLLSANASIEGPLVHILARLNTIVATDDAIQRLTLNAVGRRLLAHHVAKPVPKGWPYAVQVGVEAICRTFKNAPAESERALLTLLTPERVAKFPHDDLRVLADNLKRLDAGGDAVVIRLFEAAFAGEPQTGQWERIGTPIIPIAAQTSDQWKTLHYELAGYYAARTGENAALMTEAACIAWNAAARRQEGQMSREPRVVATIQFRGVSCELVEDYSHIWGREFEHEENSILRHFEKLLREWAASSDATRLSTALDCFARRNRTSLMWTVFMEVAAEHPSTLGVQLEGGLSEPLFLTHPDYYPAAVSLFSSLHRSGDAAQRERLEKLVLDLPKNVRLREGEKGDPMPSWVMHAQNRLLGALEEPNILSGAVRDLWRERRIADAFPANQESRRSDAGVVWSVGVARRDSELKKPANKELLHLREALGPFLVCDDKKFDIAAVERHWPVIRLCERAVKRTAKRQPEMARELWGHLVGACENVAFHANWPETSDRWKTVRRILLKAADDPLPQADSDGATKEDSRPSWRWPSPRLDAACGLPYLAHRLGRADKPVAAAIRRLCCDKSRAVRFNLALGLAVLQRPAADLMWELIDWFIANERKFSVLDALAESADQLWRTAPEKVKPLLRLIADRATQSAPADNHIHKTLAQTHLFQFLRTGDPDCGAFIASFIAACDSPRASDPLGALLHACREDGCLTAGEAAGPDTRADPVRARTWGFFSKLLITAQARLQQHREARRQLNEQGQVDDEVTKPLQENLDRAARLVDGIAMQLYFASGAFDEWSHKDKALLTRAQLCRFWQEAAPLLRALATEPHPHTVHQTVQTLRHLLRCAPSEIFVLATQSVLSGSKAGFQYESLARDDVVELIQRAIADHREIFQGDTGQDCVEALLQVLDLSVEAGWPEARQLTHRLEEIYR